MRLGGCMRTTPWIRHCGTRWHLFYVVRGSGSGVRTAARLSVYSVFKCKHSAGLTALRWSYRDAKVVTVSWSLCPSVCFGPHSSRARKTHHQRARNTKSACKTHHSGSICFSRSLPQPAWAQAGRKYSSVLSKRARTGVSVRASACATSSKQHAPQGRRCIHPALLD